MKRKRPFVLLELLIALALVALFSLPLASAQSFYVKRIRKELIELELERKAEEVFFHVCKTLTTQHPLQKISRQYKHNPHPYKPTIEVNLGLLGSRSFSCHYHLHSTTNEDQPFRKLICQVCFSEPSMKEKCQARRRFEDMAYPFHLTTSIE